MKTGSQFSRPVTRAMVAMLGLMMLSGAASATVFEIDGLGSGSAGNFSFSVFHEASSNGGKSGDVLTWISGLAPAGGRFDDLTGGLDVTLDLAVGGSVNLSGILDFGVTTPDSALGVLTATFAGAFLDRTFNITFLNHAYGGDGDIRPNSLTNGTIALWGAAGTPSSHGNFDTHTTSIGLDLVLRLDDEDHTNTTQSHSVPEPGSLAVFALGLLGLGVVGRRRRGKN